MTTQQNFFHDIVHFNAIGYSAIEQIVGDLNKNVGLVANVQQLSEQIVGNTITENYDLGSIWGYKSNQVVSDNTEVLQQSLQNTVLGFANTYANPAFRVSTHISTSLFAYNASLSSSFLSGQIYSFPSVGIATSSVISIPYNFNLDGSFFRSYLNDMPTDFAVFGLNKFNGAYTGSNLINFDYAWSSATANSNLLVSLNFSTSQYSNYYIVFYWGNNSSNFISTNYSISTGITYVGTAGFINKIGINTINTNPISLSNFSGRQNFWSNTVPTGIAFSSKAFIDTNPYLWAPQRINATLLDGIETTYTQPLRYLVVNKTNLSSVLNTSTGKYASMYSNFTTSGFGDPSTANANTNIYLSYSSNSYQNYNLISLQDYYQNQAPFSNLVFIKNPKKNNLGYSNGYSLLNYVQQIPSAFTKPIQDVNLFSNFYSSMTYAKGRAVGVLELQKNYLSTLDNFIADFFFDANFSSVESYFVAPQLAITQSVLKSFTQPYGYNRTDPLNLTKYEEYSLYHGTNIVSSKEFLKFTEGLLTFNNDYNLPLDYSFEIFKPISYVCNGIDPYNQGTGLAYDYTLNLTFGYNNQNTLSKTLYLMASKYLLSESDYNNRINSNQSVVGYYYLADPNSKDYNSYSVGSIDEFRLYGYSGYIPDLKDGTIRPILTRVFSPVDSTKYTYEQYVQLLMSQGITNPNDINDAVQKYLDEGNTFYTINLNSFSNQWASLQNISLCMTNYVLGIPKYWNDEFYNNLSGGYQIADSNTNTGFTQLISQINSGSITTGTLTPGFFITNIAVGYNCVISSVSLNDFGSGLQPGTYQSFVLPPANAISNEQAGQITYNILNQGYIDPNSIVINNPGGSFYFDFDLVLTQPGFTTNIGTSYPSVRINMDNLARFNANLDSGFNLISFTQTTPPNIGYEQGFVLNTKTFVGLGYTSNANVYILINNYPTVDSFLISNTGQTVGTLESFTNFQNTSGNNLNNINYTSGSATYALTETEIFNTLVIPQSANNSISISYISLNSKLILINNYNPAGNIKVNIYAISPFTNGNSGYTLNLLASSNPVNVTEFSNSNYTTVNVPISYTFTGNQQFVFDNSTLNSIYYVSIQNNLQNCFLSLVGSYQGINTSNYSISSSNIYNDINTYNIAGGFSTNGTDLDLGKFPLTISGIIGTNIVQNTTNNLNVYLRRDPNYSGIGTVQQVTLAISTSYQSTNDIIYSNPVSVISIGTMFAPINFVFGNIGTNIQASTVLGNANLIFSLPLGSNKMYLSRTLNSYDVSQVGFATSSLISVSNNYYNFNFVFNKIFTYVPKNIYAAFNFTNASQFGLAKPNTLRQSNPQNVVDGYWAFSPTNISSSLAVYPRAFYSNSSIIGTSSPVYKYVGYTHDIYLNIGYNSGGTFNIEHVYLPASPQWKTTWMSRDSGTYKNFNIYNVIQQSYNDSINYYLGSANTNIANNTDYKVAIFQGIFEPQGNLSMSVPITVGYGTNSGVQVYINNSPQPIIDTFSTVLGYSTYVTASLSTAVRQNSVNFKILYFTFSTAYLQVYWNVVGINTLINSYSSTNSTQNTPYQLNSGNTIDNISFMNISKTLSESDSINYGFPPGDSFVIRSS